MRRKGGMCIMEAAPIAIFVKKRKPMFLLRLSCGSSSWDHWRCSIRSRQVLCAGHMHTPLGKNTGSQVVLQGS